VLGGTIAPGGYYLVATSDGSDGGVLPAPDFTTAAPLQLSATDGKVALLATTRRLSGCPTAPAVVDLVGYGTANCSETAPAPMLTKFESLIRADLNACVDTNDNSFDLVKITPAPRRSSSPANVCR